MLHTNPLALHDSLDSPINFPRQGDGLHVVFVSGGEFNPLSRIPSSDHQRTKLTTAAIPWVRVLAAASLILSVICYDERLIPYPKKGVPLAADSGYSARPGLRRHPASTHYIFRT